MIPEIKLLNRVLLSNLIRLPFPYKLSFCVTYKCNLRCNMCSIWKKKHPPEMSIDEIRSFFCKSNWFSWVGLTGGETFLRNDLPEITKTIIENCKNLCVLHFPTNGYLTEKIVENIEKTISFKPRRLYVTLSLDGPPHIHDKIRGVEGSWQKCMNTFVALSKIKGVEPYLSMTLTADNLGAIDETISSIRRVCKNFDPRSRMNFNIFQRSSSYFDNESMDYPDTHLMETDIEKVLKLLGGKLNLKGYLQINFLKCCKSYFKNFRSPLPCRALSASCVMDPYGDIYPCVVYGKKVGNIKNYDFKLNNLWREEHVQRLYHECHKGICPGCWTPCDAYQSINGNLLNIITSYF